MHFINIALISIAGLAVASPVGSNAPVRERAVISIASCIGACVSVCVQTPLMCPACLAACLGAADDGGTINLDAAASSDKA